MNSTENSMTNLIRISFPKISLNGAYTKCFLKNNTEGKHMRKLNKEGKRNPSECPKQVKETLINKLKHDCTRKRMN